jgi:hypothetical protein
MSESTIVAIVVALTSAISAIIVALIQNRKEKQEQPTGIYLTKPLPPKKKIGLFTILPFAIIGIALFIVGALSNMGIQLSSVELTDTQIALVLNNATQINSDVQTAQALATKQQSDKATATFRAAYETVAAIDKLTLDVSDAQTQLAIQKTQTQNAISGTIIANSTAIAEVTETASYLATKSSQDREISIQETAQALIKTQEAQASATQAVHQATSDWISSHSFTDDFADDKNDWGGIGSTYKVSVSDSVLNVHIDPKYKRDYFIWTCSTCYVPTDYENYSFEVTVRSPQNASTFAGIVFGSISEIGANVEVYLAKLSLAGSFNLYRVSTNQGITENVIDIPFRNTLIGTNRNSMIIRIDVKNGYADVYINDHRLQESPIELKSPVGGYFGIFIEIPKEDSKYDSIRIRPIVP